MLFVVLRDGVELTDELVAEIRVAHPHRRVAAPRPGAGARGADLPRTRSGKLTELAVRDVVHGRPVKNVEALANPEALEQLPLEELPDDGEAGDRAAAPKPAVRAREPARRGREAARAAGPTASSSTSRMRCRPSGKADARAVARELGERLAAEHPEIAVYVRVNAVRDASGSTDDVREALHPGLAGVVVPKLESVAQLDAVADALAGAGCGGLGCSRGSRRAAGVARRRGAAAPAGDRRVLRRRGLRRRPGWRPDAGGAPRCCTRARGSCSRRGSRACTRSTRSCRRSTTRRAFVADAELGRALGYGGKVCIHPSQVTWANRVFSPSPEELDHARRLARRPTTPRPTAGEAVITFEGQMVDEPMARRARALLEAD